MNLLLTSPYPNRPCKSLPVLCSQVLIAVAAKKRRSLESLRGSKQAQMGAGKYFPDFGSYLNLRCMQVHGDYVICTCHRQHVCNQLGRDRSSALVREKKQYLRQVQLLHQDVSLPPLGNDSQAVTKRSTH